MIINRIINKIRGEVNIKDLEKNGLKVGRNFDFGKYCFFNPSFCFLITIGDNVTFSTRVHVLAHDASTKKHLDYSKVGKVKISNNCFIGANVTILPNVEIGESSIVGAGSVVTKDIPAREVWAGVPAKKVCSLQEYLDKIEGKKYKKFDGTYMVGRGITGEMKKELINEIDKKGYVLIQ